MTADPSRYPERPPAWYVITDQGLRLDGPFEARSAAAEARERVVRRLTEQMGAQRYSAAEIAARIQAVVVAHGQLVGPWQHFVPGE